MDYIILSSIAQDSMLKASDKLQEEVCEYLEKGYIPQGGVHYHQETHGEAIGHPFTNHTYTQAMIRKSLKEKGTS